MAQTTTATGYSPVSGTPATCRGHARILPHMVGRGQRDYRGSGKLHSTGDEQVGGRGGGLQQIGGCGFDCTGD